MSSKSPENTSQYENMRVTLADLERQIAEMANNLNRDYELRPDNVLQTGCQANRDIIGRIADQLMLPGSHIASARSLKELYRRCQDGQSCLVLAEHYSNFDFPLLYRLIESHPELGPPVSSSLLPIRGMKLSEVTPVTAVFTRSYDTIVIYPSRTLDAVTDPGELAEVRKLSVPVNHAAMKAMIRQKHNKRIIVVFPAGTRYRPWVPDSRKGVREIHSYLKTFDNVLFAGINGNTLPPHRSGDMARDETTKDLVFLTCSKVLDGRKFRKQKEMETPAGQDPKQYVVDQVMNELMKLHTEAEPKRLEMLKKIRK